MMSVNNYNNSSPSFPARQSSSPYSMYVSPSARQQGQRFNYATSPYSRNRSPAVKANTVSGDDSNYRSSNSSSASADYYYRSDQSYNNNYAPDADDKRDRFNSSYSSSIEFGSPGGSEYFSCNEDSFASPMDPCSASRQSAGYAGMQSQEYSPYFNAGFSGSPNNLPGPFAEGCGYPGIPVAQQQQQQQQKRRGFGQRRFTQGRNGVSAAQKRGATSDFSHQGSSGEVDGSTMQNSPVKKPKVAVRCEICNIEFTSDIPYKMHLAGAKHLKKVKSKEVLQTMETQGQVQSKENYFYCEACQVMANSSQQLQMHLDGTKHKNKMRKLSENGVNKAEAAAAAAPAAAAPAPAAAAPKEPVTDEFGPKPAKITKFYCDVCNLALNSDIQLTQHLQSKRHEAKIKGEPLPVKKKARKFTDKPTNGNETTDETTTADAPPAPVETTEEKETVAGATAVQKTFGIKELGSSFVAGGVLQ